MMIKEVEAGKLIDTLSKELEKMEAMKPPEWARFVKTGVCKERPPTQKDWWYVRSASILRKLYMEGGPVGVSKMRRIYGHRKRRGHKPEHKYPASGAIIREIFQQLEKAGLVKNEKRKGRMLTAKGKTFLKDVSGAVAKQ